MSSTHLFPGSLAFVAALSLAAASQPSSVRDAAAGIVARIQRADYEADRPSLQRLHDELASLAVPADDPTLASRLRYWQGFAFWRRALNGFNGAAPTPELDGDLQRAIALFEAALERDPGFVDAKVGLISSLGNVAALHARDDPDRTTAAVSRMMPLLKEALAAAPDNPRLLWVQGPTLWWAPPGTEASRVNERRAAAIAGYERGLELARRQKKNRSESLEPSWGEPELLMHLAWSRLNQATPDAAAAEAYAQQALELVPHWRYVRDVLMPQIRKARSR